MSQGKRRHPEPERWRERQAATAGTGVARRRAKDEQARALHAEGATIAAFARTVGIGRRTAYRDLREGPPQRKRHTVHGRQRVIAPYEPYLLNSRARHGPGRAAGTSGDVLARARGMVAVALTVFGA